MTPHQIMDTMVSLEERIMLKGYYRPKATFRINWVGYPMTVSIEHRTHDGAACETKFVHATLDDGFEGLFDQADAYVDGLVSIEDAKKNAFIAAIGRLIDQGRDIGIDVEYMNPLTEMMGKLSTNIITKE